MIDWKLPVAIIIGLFFVYQSNKKVAKKLTDRFKEKEEKEKNER
ncbi:hypothetical protein KORDIASMS9_03622 [Kordia sp. SMS9]|nr:hypothetical protein [Kordia sp. SMS9]AXG71365.1 hypothetical protein KORDIASMS9_03622 [Kordia sp. SMS9]